MNPAADRLRRALEEYQAADQAVRDALARVTAPSPAADAREREQLVYRLQTARVSREGAAMFLAATVRHVLEEHGR